ncbi:MAG: type III-B CRISPR module RAMP protein Cmr1 [Armatimonadetes bacterium]|nr:type III-B CRISPR module RAMP protein Cmr1 [Armatimonadota bacterium]
MRFWLRALLGGILGDNPQEIFKRESAVFGSTEHASPVVVRVRRIGELNVKDHNPLPHKPTRFYFKGFDPSQTFTIVLLSRDVSSLDQAAKALHLLCLLGGLGRRSRRGFGSLQIVDGDLPSLNVSTIDELCSELSDRLSAILGKKFASISSVPKFPVLHPDWAQVKVCQNEFNGWQEAIKEVMLKAHEHKNPALGWAGGKEERQASPVHVHVIKLANGKHALVLTTLLSQLNPKLLNRAERKELTGFLKAFDGEVVFGFEKVPEN